MVIVWLMILGYHISYHRDIEGRNWISKEELVWWEIFSHFLASLLNDVPKQNGSWTTTHNFSSPN